MVMLKTLKTGLLYAFLVIMLMVVGQLAFTFEIEVILVNGMGQDVRVHCVSAVNDLDEMTLLNGLKHFTCDIISGGYPE